MLVPLLTSLEESYRISAVAAIWISLIALLSGAAFVPTLCRLGDTIGWKKSLVIAGLIVEHHASFRIVFWGACVLPALGILGIVFLVPNGRGRPPGVPAKSRSTARWRTWLCA